MSDSGRWVGRLFYTRGPAAVNECSPRPVMVCCMRHVSMSDKCSCQCPVTDTSITDLHCDRNYTHSHSLHIFHFHSCMSPSSFSSIPTSPHRTSISSPTVPAKIILHTHPFLQNYLPVLINKKFPTLNEADVSICVIIVLKHAIKVLHMKEMDAGYIC